MLSRAQKLEQIFIIEKLFEDNWTVSQSAVDELEDSKKKAVNLKNIDDDKDIILSLNCYSLRKHFDDVCRLQRQRNYKMICLQETWLHDSTDEAEYAIDGMELHLNSVGLGKGIASYYVDEYAVEESLTEPDCQLTRISTDKYDVINVYRSARCDNFEEQLQAIIHEDRSTIVCGDTNIDANDKGKLMYLMNMLGFRQLVKKPTHMKGGTIDHVYISDHLIGKVIVTQEACRFSDHDLILIEVDLD